MYHGPNELQGRKVAGRWVFMVIRLEKINDCHHITMEKMCDLYQSDVATGRHVSAGPGLARVRSLRCCQVSVGYDNSHRGGAKYDGLGARTVWSMTSLHDRQI